MPVYLVSYLHCSLHSVCRVAALPAASAAPHAPANDRPLSATHSSASLEYLSGGRERPADDAAPDDDDDGREASPPYFPRVFNTSAVRSHDPSLDSTIRVPHESPLASSTSNLLAAFSADPTELPPQQSSSAGVVRLSWPPAGPTPALHRLSPASRAGPVPLLDPVLDFLRRMAPRVPAAHGDFSRLQAVSRLINSSEDVDVLAEHAGNFVPAKCTLIPGCYSGQIFSADLISSSARSDACCS